MVKNFSDIFCLNGLKLGNDNSESKYIKPVKFSSYSIFFVELLVDLWEGVVFKTHESSSSKT